MSFIKRRKKGKLPIHLYLIYMIIATLLFTGVTFSSYVSTSEGGDEVQVALFANDTEVILPVTECYPGCEFTIQVTVTNYEGDKVCEVSQAYSITAETVTGSIPLELDWLEVDGDPVGNFHINDGEKQVKVYDLKVTWPVTDSNITSEYADEIEVIRIIIDCNQID